MSIECPTCTKECSDSDYAKHHLAFVKAGLADESEPSCQQFKLRTFRGLEGVVDHRYASRFVVHHEPLFMRDNQNER